MAISDFVEETARAKVNLALHVVGRRRDGYHLLDSIVLFADIFDRLLLTRAKASSLEIAGPLSAGIDPNDNLVSRAHRAMVERFGTLIPDVAIVLEKYVPAAAGLGGGSADAAAMLRALCRLSGLNPLSSEVQKIALSIGADVPACLHSRACRMRGIGERIEILPEFPSLHVVLANARLPVSTADVFQALKLKPGEAGYPPIALPFELTTSRNDLTPAATGLAPIVNDVLEALRAAPDVRFVRMSGSGGTCFAVFDSHAAAGKAAGELASLHPDWWIRPAVLQ